MMKYLFNRLIFMIVLLSLSSCKLYQSRNKEDLKEEQMQSNYHQQVDVLFRGLKDSQSRYWFFWTDSGFSFHPDSGLIGQSGQLAMMESKVKTSAKNETSVNTSDNRQLTKQKLSTDKHSTWAFSNLWLIGLVPVIFAIVWKFRFFLKHSCAH